MDVVESKKYYVKDTAVKIDKLQESETLKKTSD
jgi:hypothetical protein